MEIIHKICLLILLLSAVFITNSVTHAQQEEKPCSSPEASQFDFWAGEWLLDWQNAEGETDYGKNSIEKKLGGCVIQENFLDDNKTFSGQSVSVYNPNKKQWQQTWVDDAGGYMVFTGGFADGKMTLSRKVTGKTGSEITQRMVFYDITQNEFYWNWESSTDDGKTWTLNWKIHYKRK